MEEEIKLIEENIDYNSLLFGYGDAELSEKLRNAIRHLIQAYKEDETQINKLKRQAKMTAEEHEKVFNLIDKIIDLMLDDLDINDHGREALFRSYEDRATEILKKREEKQ